jgi:hydroxyacyl-ACP dehydratase HTD2-like protein with hotdog domain
LLGSARLRYAGIVVHGPLLSLLMSRLLEKQSMQASRIDYRALSTLYVGDRALVSGNAAGEVQVTGPAGELAMSARAVLV